MTSVADALRWAEAELSGVLVRAEAASDARCLLAQVLQKNQAALRAFPEQALSAEQWQQFAGWIARRRAGEPVAYLCGCQGFWSFELAVTADTLVPRADTELLVETALTLRDAGACAVLDLGTGTGAIALALKSERSAWQVQAADIDPASVALARHNAAQLRLTVAVRVSDWLQSFDGERFHLLLSNPPYIAADDPHLQGMGVRCEPLRALVAGADGLEAIRAIVASAPQHLHAGGWLLLEHGFGQGAAVRELLRQQLFDAVETRRDLGGNERVTLGQWMPAAAQTLSQ